MALLNLVRSSEILANQITVEVILPDELTPKQLLPTVWLFHGLGDNGTTWQRKTNIEQLAREYNVAIIMPNFERSFYTNMAYGGRYWDYLTQELIPQMRCFLPLSSDASQNYLVGNSMGGYGALKLAACHPSWFSAVAAISPVTDLLILPRIMPDYQAVFGDGGKEFAKAQLRGLFSQADTQALQKLRWYQTVGEQDFLKDSNDTFNQYLTKKIGLSVNYYTAPGEHDWNFWNKQIGPVLQWLLTDKEG